MHHILKNQVLPVMAGAALVVGGLNVASYAGDGHRSATPHQARAHGGGFGHSGAAVSVRAAKRHPGAYTFTVPKHTKLPFAFKLKGVPAGRYAAAFNVATFTATPTSPAPFCGVGDSTSLYSVVSFGVGVGNPTDEVAVNSASGIVKLKQKNQITLSCDNADRTYNQGHSKNVLVLTPLHRVVAVDAKKQPQMRTGASGFGR